MTPTLRAILAALNTNHRKATMSNPNPNAAEALRPVIELVKVLAEQARRIADILAEPPRRDAYALAPTPADGPADSSPTGADDYRQQIAAALEAADYRRDMRRGDLADSVMPIVNQLLARIATLEHVAKGNKRHVQQIVPDLERAEAEVARLQARDTPTWRQRAEEAEAALALLHEGEEPHQDARIAATPAQWIWCWNRATPEARLAVATQVQQTADRADTAEATIRRLRAVHHAAGYRGQRVCAHCSGYEDGSSCDFGPVQYPCTTITTLDGPSTPAEQRRPVEAPYDTCYCHAPSGHDLCARCPGLTEALDA